jgi:D-arabinose 1-dehydrogenase-like Zn-dependent alcohol dehydrogenase
MAADAGYIVVGVASGRHAELAKSLGISSFVDRSSSEVLPTLTGLGPFKAVFAAADSAEDQVKIGEVLAAHGGGTFLSTMGVRKGVQLPQGVSGKFTQYVDDFLNPENREFTEWVWWDYLEKAVSQGKLKSTPVEAKGDLSQTKAAWKALKAGEVSGKRFIICPNSE